MAFNNGFPYQPYYYPQAQTPITQAIPNAMQTGNSNSIIWVQGEAGAKSYLVAPNNTVQLWDSEANTIYLKSADASGMPSMKILDYTVRNTEQPQAAPQLQQNHAYVTAEELNAVKAELNKIKNELKSLSGGTEHE